jgi:hypothetical protein
MGQPEPVRAARTKIKELRRIYNRVLLCCDHPEIRKAAEQHFDTGQTYYWRLKRTIKGQIPREAPNS